MCCVSWGDVNICLVVLDRDLMMDWSKDTQVQLGNPVNFVGVTYGSMGEGITCRSRSDSDSCITKRPPPASVAAHKRWKPGAHCTAWNNWTGKRMPFPDSSVGLILFQAAWLGWESLLAVLTACIFRRGRSLVNLMGFRDLLAIQLFTSWT